MMRATIAGLAVLTWGAGVALLAPLHGAVDADPYTLAGVLAIAAAICSVAAGAWGRIAAATAVAMASLHAAIQPSAGSIAFAGVVVLCVVAGRAVSEGLSTSRLVADAAISDRLHGTSLLLDDRAQAELTRARRHGRPLTVLRLSIAGGRHARAPVKGAFEVARELTTRLRLTDAVGVTDGAEVVVLLPETSGEVMPTLMERLHDALGVRAGFTAGYASFPDDAVTWAALKHQAELRPVAVSPTLDPEAPALVHHGEVGPPALAHSGGSES